MVRDPRTRVFSNLQGRVIFHPDGGISLRDFFENCVLIVVPTGILFVEKASRSQLRCAVSTVQIREPYSFSAANMVPVVKRW